MSRKIPYNPEILKWARNELSYSLEDIASKFDKSIEIIEGWENGTESPTYIQLERLAYDIYKKPLAVFFFPEAPKDDTVNKSFRTIAEYELEQLPPKLKLIINKALALQLNIKELTDDINPSSYQILQNLQFIPEMSTHDMVLKLRSFLNITLDEQLKWKNEAKALKSWINCLEELGIFVFKDAFKDANYSGFCLYDNEFPIIYLNSSMSKTRQIFTLFHELAHLLFNTSGIDSRKHLDYYHGIEESIEIHCNQLAGKFLIPDKEFNMQTKNLIIDDESLSQLGRLYSVSREAILRKFLDLKRVTQEYYEEKREEWNNVALKSKTKETKRGIYINNVNSYLSNSYKSIVFDKYLRNELSIDQTSSYFNIKSNHLQQLTSLYVRNGKK